MIEGNFIVLEGIDGSGTTTQAAALKRRFLDQGLPAHVTAEPSRGPVGSIIRQILTGRLVFHHHQRVTAPSWRIMALLFAADRQDHLEAEISPNLRDGVNVICDRYVFSSIAYQSVSSEDPDAVDWIRTLNRYVRTPDLILYLRLPPEEAIRRCRERDQGLELFDEPEFQKKLAVAYDTIHNLQRDTNVVTIDAAAPIDAVTDACWSHVVSLRSDGGVA
ncbi:MAG: dTMP kinase [Myxococcota bacterium]|nr:dTMP kinase [Myxococcota bacterium]